jgi:hypothetical protein
MIHYLHKVYHRAFMHSHEIVAALLVELGKGPLVMVLLIAAAVLVLIALQVLAGAEIE